MLYKLSYTQIPLLNITWALPFCCPYPSYQVASWESLHGTSGIVFITLCLGYRADKMLT